MLTARPILIGIDLMSTPMKLSLLRRNRLRTWSMILTLAAGLSAIPFVIELLNQQRLGKAFEANQRRSQAIQEAGQTLAAVQLQAQIHADQLAFSRALRAKRHWSSLLGLVADATDNEVWLTAIQSGTAPAIAKPAPSAPNPAAPANSAPQITEVVLDGPRSLILEGFAVDHARLYQLMAVLRDRGRFIDLNLSRAGAEKHGAGSAIRFRLECQW